MHYCNPMLYKGDVLKVIKFACIHWKICVGIFMYLLQITSNPNIFRYNVQHNNVVLLTHMRYNAIIYRALKFYNYCQRKQLEYTTPFQDKTFHLAYVVHNFLLCENPIPSTNVIRKKHYPTVIWMAKKQCVREMQNDDFKRICKCQRCISNVT